MKKLLYLLSVIYFCLLGQAPFAAEMQINWQFKTGGAIWGDSLSQNGVTYFGSADGNLYALNTQSGEKIWQFTTEGALHGGVAINGDALYFLSDDGNVYKLSKDQGKLLWKANIHLGKTPERDIYDAFCCPWDYRGSIPTVKDGVVYIASPDKNIYALNANDGSTKWTFKTKRHLRSSPLLADGKIVFGGWDGRIRALNAADGSEVWQIKTYVPYTSTAAIHKGMVYIGGRNSKIVAISLANGNIKWEHTIANGSWVESSPTIFDNILYIGSSAISRSMALNIETGEEIWSLKALEGADVSQPLVTQSAVYQGIMGFDADFLPEGGLVKIDRNSGEMIWKYVVNPPTGVTGFGVVGAPEFADDAVLFGSLGGVFYSIKP